jgi:hypothetical protein
VKAYLLFNRQTPGEGMMQDMQNRLQEADVQVELVDADSPGGIGIAQDYDVLGRPAVVLVREDGTLVQAWQGSDGLPTVSDVSYLAHQ